MDSEFDRFKIEISLPEVAASLGYALDKRLTSHNSVVMRRDDGDKIVIARHAGTNHWVYFSVRDDRDNGTVIDFLQHRTGGSLGDVRKTLREWSGTSRTAPRILPTAISEIKPVSHDRSKVLAAWEKAVECQSSGYLSSRGITQEVLAQPHLAGMVRVDSRHNVLFPHYDQDGLCGYEMKNKGFTGFAPGGKKGLWFNRPEEKAHLVITESAIDAISYSVLHGSNDNLCLSTGGELNPDQPALIRSAIDKMPATARIVIAVDNDLGGDKIAAELMTLVPESRQAVRIKPGEKDWNDMLKKKLKSPSHEKEVITAAAGKALEHMPSDQRQKIMAAVSQRLDNGEHQGRLLAVVQPKTERSKEPTRNKEQDRIIAR